MTDLDELIPDVDIPNGTSGDWKVERYDVDIVTASISRMRDGNRYCPAGRYTRLVCGSDVVMSDTRAEKRDHLRFVRAAKGKVLINGLGLGMALGAVLRKKKDEDKDGYDGHLVTEVTVIEKSEDVIKLVADNYTSDPRVTVINADAFEWKAPRGSRWDCVWHDIWNDICTDNLPEMKRLHRKYGGRCNWQMSWCRDICEMEMARDQELKRRIRRLSRLSLASY